MLYSGAEHLDSVAVELGHRVYSVKKGGQYSEDAMELDLPRLRHEVLQSLCEYQLCIDEKDRFRVTQRASRAPLLFDPESSFDFAVKPHFVSPKLMEIYGSIYAIIYTQIPAIILLALIPFSPTFTIAAFLYILRTILMNFAHPIHITLTMNKVREEDRSVASSVTTMAWNGTSAIGTIIGGQLMEYQIDLLPFLCSISYAFSILLLYHRYRISHTL